MSNEQTFNPVTLESSNGGASRRQGVELAWRIPASSAVSVDGEWTFNDARYRSLIAVPEERGAPAVLNGLRIFNTSRYVGSAGLDVSVPNARWLVRIAGNWVGPYSPFDRPGDVQPGYGLAHVSARCHVGEFEIDGGVRNLFDRAYPELVAGDVVSPGEPRTLYVNLRAHFGS